MRESRGGGVDHTKGRGFFVYASQLWPIPNSGSCHCRQVVHVTCRVLTHVQSWKIWLPFGCDCYSSRKTSANDHFTSHFPAQPLGSRALWLRLDSPSTDPWTPGLDFQQIHSGKAGNTPLMPKCHVSFWGFLRGGSTTEHN